MKWTISLWMALLLLSVAAAAEAPLMYNPAGAVANPKVPAHWNRYHDHAQATGLLQQLAAAHPGFARLESLGKSYGGREMWVLTVTDFSTGDPSRKPGFWIDGGIHANEVQGVEVVLYTAWYLLENRDASEFIGTLVRDRVFYLLPMMSPDSRDEHFYSPNDTNSPRTGQIPVDDDRDGLIDEDKPEDMDGDGVIANMRVADPNGRYKPDQDFPDRMIPAKPEERGEYSLLGDEGYDNDGDGFVNEDSDGTYDPNRNWAWDWQPEYVQWGAHNYPFSLPENRMAADFIMAHPNIAGAQSYHNTAGMILHGPGNPSSPYNSADERVFDLIADKGAEILPGYTNSVIHEDLYPVFGGETDWLYQMQGILAFTNELFTSYNYFHKQRTGDWLGSRDDQRKFDKLLLFGEGYIPWHTVEHPQYGTVEVGGANKNWGRQPPSFMLEEECHRNMAFTLFHADQMPQVEVQSVEVRALDGGLSEVTAAVINPRLIPTHLAADVEHRITRPDWISISGTEAVIAGMWSTSRYFEWPAEQKLNPERMEIPSIGAQGVVYVRWIVQGGGPFTVTADSVKGGVAQSSSQ